MIYVFGDLNFRILQPNDVVRPSVQRKEYEFLKNYDELIQGFRKYNSPDAQQIL